MLGNFSFLDWAKHSSRTNVEAFIYLPEKFRPDAGPLCVRMGTLPIIVHANAYNAVSDHGTGRGDASRRPNHALKLG
jgi:hypothetical protein